MLIWLFSWTGLIKRAKVHSSTPSTVKLSCPRARPCCRSFRSATLATWNWSSHTKNFSRIAQRSSTAKFGRQFSKAKQKLSKVAKISSKTPHLTSRRHIAYSIKATPTSIRMKARAPRVTSHERNLETLFNLTLLTGIFCLLDSTKDCTWTASATQR